MPEADAEILLLCSAFDTLQCQKAALFDAFPVWPRQDR
jgi:hypothetical protein